MTAAAAVAAPPIVEAIGLHTYYGASHVLHGVSLAVERGAAVALMGRNGMGKTTTIRSILGLTPPRRGEVRIDGRDMAGRPPHAIVGRGLAVVPEGRRIFPALSVKENLVMAARPAAGGVGWDLAGVVALFPALAARLSHRGDRISGGEQQMLAIGRALMTNPRLLIVDEATEGLAPRVRDEVWAVIRRIKEAGTAVLIVDKDLGRLLALCDSFVILAKGRVVYSGGGAALAADPDIHRRHLGI